MAPNYGPRIVTDGLVLCLDAANPKSYPGTGTTWSDLAGNGNDGTLVNGVGYSSDNLGSMTFDGVDDYAQIPHTQKLSDEIFSNTLQATLESWVNASSFQNWTTMISKAFGSSYSNSTGPALWSNSTGYQFVVASGVSSNPSGSYKILSFTANTNQWYHFAGTVSGNTAILYINGQEITSSTAAINTIQTNTSPITIGRRCTTCNPSFDGKISSVSIYNRALSADEVRQNFSALRGRYGL